jgi:hypothetical protein
MLGPILFGDDHPRVPYGLLPAIDEVYRTLYSSFCVIDGLKNLGRSAKIIGCE